MKWLALPFDFVRLGALAWVLASCTTLANAAFFEDEEARKAILDLRQRADVLRTEIEQSKSANTAEATERAAETAGLTKSLLDLQRQIELMRTEIAHLRGLNEQLAKDLTDQQRLQKDNLQLVLERVGRLEPVKVHLDGTEFMAEQAEKKEFDTAIKIFRSGDFSTAQAALVGFVGRYPLSGYASSALFWLGNAQYATRDYKEAIINFRALLTRTPDHQRAPEALLSIANCQLELKDAKSARKTLTDLLAAYPQSEAGAAAKDRLATLK